MQNISVQKNPKKQKTFPPEITQGDLENWLTSGVKHHPINKFAYKRKHPPTNPPDPGKLSRKNCISFNSTGWRLGSVELVGLIIQCFGDLSFSNTLKKIFC